MNARLTQPFSSWLNVATLLLSVGMGVAGGVAMAGSSLGFKTTTPQEQVDALAARLDAKNQDQDLVIGTFDARIAEVQDSFRNFRSEQQIQTALLCRVAKELRIDISLSTLQRRCGT